jgi:hypothetical protein
LIKFEIIFQIQKQFLIYDDIFVLFEMQMLSVSHSSNTAARKRRRGLSFAGSGRHQQQKARPPAKGAGRRENANVFILSPRAATPG